jgi:hypothetical protein
MTASVFVDGRKLSLNPFMNSLTANILEATARSLKAQSGKRLEFVLAGENLMLSVEGQDIALDAGSARRIVGNVLKGLLQSLHGAEKGKEFRFIYEP